MPEVAQAAYLNAIAQERAIGDYVAIPDNSIKVTEELDCAWSQ